MTYEEFELQYCPIQNEIETGESSFENCMFETYGKEYAFVTSHEITQIWTIVEGDDNQIIISPGLHLVNRMGYLITQNHWDVDNIPNDIIDD